MSFILDALRKSETDRQRQAGPGLIDAGYRPPARRRTLWLPLLVAVLVANLVGMAFLWQRREAPPAQPAPPEVVATPAAPAVAAPAPQQSVAPPAAIPAPAEAEFADTADLPAVETGQTEVLPPPPPAAAEPAPEQPTALAAATRHITEDLPSAQQLMASGAIPTQDLHLDIHVWSAAPAERFVFINMRKYGEGAQLPMGVRVEEITRDGVVLSQDGQRFLLNRD